MSHIKNFNQVHLNEADEPMLAPADPAAAPADPAAAGEEVEVAKMPHASDILVAGKKFFRELEGHVRYWFKYGRISKTLTLDSAKPTNKGLCIWAKQVEPQNKKVKYSIRVELNVVDNSVAIQKIEDVVLAIHIFTPDQSLLKQSELIVKVADLSEKRLRNEITKVKDAIIQKPKDKLDVRKFARKEPGALGDDIY